MEIKNRPSIPEVVTEKDLHEILIYIGTEREEKGTSETLIPFIRRVRNKAEGLGEKTIVLQLYQEEFLSAQHMIMEEKTNEPHGNQARSDRGLKIMELTSKIMETYAQEHDKDVKPVTKTRVFRYLGRFADYKGQFIESEKYYKKGLEYFDQLTNLDDKYHRLELSGFLAYSLFKQGKTDEGMDLTRQTLKDLDESEEGKWLKANDYYAWAVWKSGVEIRTAEHIIDTRDKSRVSIAEDFITDAERILEMPDGNTQKFVLRLGELNSVKSNFN